MISCMQLLIIEDDKLLSKNMADWLSNAGHEVRTAGTAEAAMELLGTGAFQLVLLDLSLPDADGMQLLDSIRERGGTIPVIIITARDSVRYKIDGLNRGADDYVTKPFELAELEARVNSVLRRSTSRLATSVTAGKLRIDRESRCLSMEGKLIETSLNELAIIDVLAANLSTLVAKEQLMSELSRGSEPVSGNVIEVYVHKLRKKIQGSGVSIRTIRGMGYILEPD